MKSGLKKRSGGPSGPLGENSVGENLSPFAGYAGPVTLDAQDGRIAGRHWGRANFSAQHTVREIRIELPVHVARVALRFTPR